MQSRRDNNNNNNNNNNSNNNNNNRTSSANQTSPLYVRARSDHIDTFHYPECHIPPSPPGFKYSDKKELADYYPSTCTKTAADVGSFQCSDGN